MKCGMRRADAETPASCVLTVYVVVAGRKTCLWMGWGWDGDARGRSVCAQWPGSGGAKRNMLIWHGHTAAAQAAHMLLTYTPHACPLLCCVVQCMHRNHMPTPYGHYQPVIVLRVCLSRATGYTVTRTCASYVMCPGDQH